jgi:hypothetical protein
MLAAAEGAFVRERPKRRLLSQARSRSKGPLSDQVADATKPRGQCRSWVEPPRSEAWAGRSGIGGSAPSDKLQARVGFPPDFSRRRCSRRTFCSLMVVRRGRRIAPYSDAAKTDRLFGEDCDSSPARNAWRIPGVRSTGKSCGESVAGSFPYRPAKCRLR